MVATGARRGFGALRSPKAPSVLGDEHPLSRSATLIHTLAVQATATSSTVLLGVVAVAERRSWGVRLLTAAVLVELTLLAILALARQIQREHILRLIASGGQRLRLEEVSREVNRLARPAYSAQLARRLERSLEDAEAWYQIPIGSRPPRGIKQLAAFAEETRGIVEQLRTGPAAVPGLALLDLMLSDGYDSTLYAGDRDALRDQLSRISQLLGRGSERCAISHHPQRRRLRDLASGSQIVDKRVRRTKEHS
jgi:hypothetical protein